MKIRKKTIKEQVEEGMNINCFITNKNAKHKPIAEKMELEEGIYKVKNKSKNKIKKICHLWE